VEAYTTGPEWGLSWSYDGFGNMLSQTVHKGSGPSFSQAVDTTAHHLIANTNTNTNAHRTT
jgi:hypothetical protein